MSAGCTAEDLPDCISTDVLQRKT